MHKHLVSALALVGLAVVAVVGTAFAGSQSSLADARDATNQFHDLAVAKAAGYTIELPDTTGATCIANLSDPSAGAMGVHFVNLGLLDDPATPTGPPDDITLDPTKPEVLVYEHRNDGSFKLVAVEYVVFKEAWDAEHSDRPQLFGQVFDSNTGTRYGLPPFYALHAWIWKPNNKTLDPAGIFAQWNPSVSC
jgi:hypothetical protein